MLSTITWPATEKKLPECISSQRTKDDSPERGARQELHGRPTETDDKQYHSSPDGQEEIYLEFKAFNHSITVITLRLRIWRQSLHYTVPPREPSSCASS